MKQHNNAKSQRQRLSEIAELVRTVENGRTQSEDSLDGWNRLCQEVRTTRSHIFGQELFVENIDIFLSTEAALNRINSGT